jgi:hypothetical protein
MLTIKEKVIPISATFRQDLDGLINENRWITAANSVQAP